MSCKGGTRAALEFLTFVSPDLPHMPADLFITSARTEVPMDRTQSLLARDFNLSIRDRFSSAGIFGSAWTASANLFRTSVKEMDVNISSSYCPNWSMEFLLNCNGAQDRKSRGLPGLQEINPFGGYLDKEPAP